MNELDVCQPQGLHPFIKYRRKSLLIYLLSSPSTFTLQKLPPFWI